MKTLLRNAIVAGLLAAAWFLKPNADVPAPSPAPLVDPPAAEMRERVAGVVAALRPATASDRRIWSELWSKAALVAASDSLAEKPLFTTTNTLRQFNVISLNIAWRRLNGNQPGKYDGLGKATESAFEDTLGLESRPVTEDVRASYVELCNALAWAGSPKE